MTDCDDGNVCTTDSCDLESGCVYAPAAGNCFDQDLCTTDDFCQAGECVGGPPLDCEDDNECTEDLCNPDSGCYAGFLEGGCDDGNECTVGEECLEGACSGGDALDCDDGDDCTEDSCDAETGCGHAPLTGNECDDGDPATPVGLCQAGECVNWCADGYVHADSNGVTRCWHMWWTYENHVSCNEVCAEYGGCVQEDWNDDSSCTVMKYFHSIGGVHGGGECKPHAATYAPCWSGGSVMWYRSAGSQSCGQPSPAGSYENRLCVCNY